MRDTRILLVQLDRKLYVFYQMLTLHDPNHLKPSQFLLFSIAFGIFVMVNILGTSNLIHRSIIARASLRMTDHP